jgi:protein SCO1/2
MKKFGLILLVILVSACGQKQKPVTVLPYFNTPDFTPTWPDKNTSEFEHLHVIPAFSFTDQDGKIITNKTMQNKVYVADFFFTRCGSICPKMTDNMGMVAKAFMNDANVAILSHSVTPELDNVAILKKYAVDKRIINPNWHLLTGDRQQVYTIARRGYFADNETGFTKDATQFLHTENFILVDRKGHIRGVYNGTLPYEVENLVRHIRLLEEEI